jgi:hypothetical protein
VDAGKFLKKNYKALATTTITNKQTLVSSIITKAKKNISWAETAVQ